MVQGMIRLFVLPFEDDAHRTRHTGFLLPKVKKKKDYCVMTDERNFFDQPIKEDIKTYEKGKIAIGQ